jgi:hypothetical protein
MLRTCLLVLLLATSAACASAPQTAHPQRVTYVDYRKNAWLELVNETHTGRVEQYSEVRENASRKVQTDEVMQGLVEVIRKGGFERQARPGPAPRASDGTSVVALEIQDGERIEHVLGFKGMPSSDHKQLLSMSQSFIEIYNLTYGLQAVEKKQGETPFENPVGPTRNKAPKVSAGKS